MATFTAAINGYHLNFKCDDCDLIVNAEYLGTVNDQYKPELLLKCNQHGTFTVKVNLTNTETWPKQPEPKH
jgi:hypothetical protein